MQIYDRFNNSEYWEHYAELRSHTWDDYDDWQTKYGEKNRKAFLAYTSMARTHIVNYAYNKTTKESYDLPT
jgi:hypothetical protein